MTDQTIQVGDVVQVNASHHFSRWRGCLLIVLAIKDTGYVTLEPFFKIMPFFEFNEVQRIGKATSIPDCKAALLYGKIK